jgi:hypothetical protein
MGGGVMERPRLTQPLQHSEQNSCRHARRVIFLDTSVSSKQIAQLIFPSYTSFTLYVARHRGHVVMSTSSSVL